MDSESGGNGGLLKNPRHVTSDLAMIRKAARWGIPPEKRALIRDELLRLVKKRTLTTLAGEDEPADLDNDRNQIAAARTLAVLEAQDQADEHHADKQKVDETRLQMEAARMLLDGLDDAAKVRLAVQFGMVEKLPPRLQELAQSMQNAPMKEGPPS